MSEDNKSQESSSSGISFKLNKSIFGTKIVTSLLSSEENPEDEQKDYLVSVEGKKLKSVVPKAGPKEYIIPLIKTNKWRNPNNNEDTASSKEDITETDIDKLAAKAILNDIASGKFLSQTTTTETGLAEKGLVIPLMMQNKPPVEIEEDKLSDLPFRPEQSSLDDYDRIPIEHYGAAMLKGMGWKPGQPIGLNKKGLIEPIEYIAHPGGLGLGATPRPPDPKKKAKIKKPGGVEKKRPVPYKDKDGRIKHIKKIGEEIPEQRPEGFYVGNFAVVCSGPHKGLYGKIVAVDEDNTRVILKLAINNENMAFSQHHLDLVSEEEYEKYGKSEKKYGLIKSKKSSSYVSEKRSRYDDNDDVTMRTKKYKSSYTDNKRDSASFKENDRDYKTNSHHHSKDRQSKREKEFSKKVDVKEETDCWLAPNLRVRIIDRELKNGQFYNKKVKIVDVIEMSSCVCQTDEGLLLENITQSMLETLVPKTGNSHVMVVGGKKKGELGAIIKRDSSQYTVVIQLIHSDELLTLDYDSICEYTGDIDTYR